MNEEQFNAMLAVVFIPPIIELIVQRLGVDEIQAATLFYNSQVYDALTDEKLKVWHFSPLLIFEMFLEEHKTGSFSYPEEAC